jgi:hypothetical protein
MWRGELDAYELQYRQEYGLTPEESNAFKHAFAAANNKAFLIEHGVNPATAAAAVNSLGAIVEYGNSHNYEPQSFADFNKDFWNDGFGSQYDPTKGQTPEAYARAGLDAGDLIVSKNVNGQNGRVADFDARAIVEALTLLKQIIQYNWDPNMDELRDIVDATLNFLLHTFLAPDDSTANPADPIGGAGDATNFRYSPIALDLNGDGIRYTAMDSNHTFFDIDSDKFAEHVEWLDRNDRFLVRDLNANGAGENNHLASILAVAHMQKICYVQCNNKKNPQVAEDKNREAGK